MRGKKKGKEGRKKITEELRDVSEDVTNKKGEDRGGKRMRGEKAVSVFLLNERKVRVGGEVRGGGRRDQRS